MKKTISVVALMVFWACSLTGCSRTQKVFAAPGELGAPSEPLGQIQVELAVPRMGFGRMFHCVGEWMVFNKCPASGQREYLQGLLDKKLIKAAKKRYDAEAVIHVQYWPDLSSKKFPHGMVYAKGEMIRYKRFAE